MRTLLRLRTSFFTGMFMPLHSSWMFDAINDEHATKPRLPFELHTRHFQVKQFAFLLVGFDPTKGTPHLLAQSQREKFDKMEQQWVR